MTIDNRFYQLIAHLWRGGKYGLYWTSDDGQGEKYTFWLTLSTAVDYSVPKLFLDANAYFGVNPSIIRRSQHERARIEDVQAVNGFFCEFDCPTQADKEAAMRRIIAWKIPPSCVIDSGGGYHVYILLRAPLVLDTPEKRQRAADLQWAFAQWAGGDTSVNDLARVLRIPGTTNHKARYGPDGAPVRIVEWQPQRQVDLAELEPMLQPYVDQRNAKIYAIPPKISTTLTVNDDKLLAALFRSKNGTDYQRLWSGDLSVCDGNHSRCDQYLCDGLAWVTGRDINRMDQLFRQSGLMRDKWNRDDYRKSTLENAANSAYMDYDPFRGIDPSAIAAVEAMLK